MIYILSNAVNYYQMAQVHFSTDEKPSYGELIDSFKNFESSEDLISNFRKQYFCIVTGRRFYDTVSRIAATTRPSLRGESCLTGMQVIAYRKRTWEPRIRSKSGI